MDVLELLLLLAVIFPVWFFPPFAGWCAWKLHKTGAVTVRDIICAGWFGAFGYLSVTAAAVILTAQWYDGAKNKKLVARRACAARRELTPKRKTANENPATYKTGGWMDG